MSRAEAVYQIGGLCARIFESKSVMGAAAASQAAAILKERIQERGHARIVIATGNSQNEFVDSLVAFRDLPWGCVEVFHMDEYIGMSASHPSSFRRWVRTRVADVVHPGKVHYLAGDADDLDQECLRYAALLTSGPIDICFVGIGENGHIAFNDPHLADFADPLLVKRVTLDEACRLQQVGEGHFPSLSATPREAITLTCPALMAADTLICCVPDRRKAEAVRCALDGPVSPRCPGSLVRTHPRAFLYLDDESASLSSVLRDHKSGMERRR